MNFTEEDRTPWFPGEIAPVHDGVYERRYYGDDADIDPCAFVAGSWYPGGFTVELAWHQREHPRSFYQPNNDGGDFEWRGLAQDPSAPVRVVAADAPGLALDSGEFIPADEINNPKPAADAEEEELF